MERTKEKVTRVPFRGLLTNSGDLTAGFRCDVISLTPDITSRLDTIADCYQLYRFVEIHARLFATELEDDATQRVEVMLCYNNEITDGTPQSATSAAQYPMVIHNPCSDGNNLAGVNVHPEPVMHLDRKILLGENPAKWWKANLSSNVDTWEEQQGEFLLVYDSDASTSTTVSSSVEIWGVVEFAVPLPISATPKTEDVRIRRDPTIVSRSGAGCHPKQRRSAFRREKASSPGE